MIHFIQTVGWECKQSCCFCCLVKIDILALIASNFTFHVHSEFRLFIVYTLMPLQEFSPFKSVTSPTSLTYFLFSLIFRKILYILSLLLAFSWHDNHNSNNNNSIKSNSIDIFWKLREWGNQVRSCRAY